MIPPDYIARSPGRTRKPFRVNEFEGHTESSFSARAGNCGQALRRERLSAALTTEVQMHEQAMQSRYRDSLRDTLLAALVVLPIFASHRAAVPAIQAAAPNTVVRWNQIAEDAVIRSRAFQAEGFLYMGYVAAAVYDAVVAIEGGYQPYGSGVTAPPGASTDGAVIEAAYRSLIHYFPDQASVLDPLYAAALAGVAAGQAMTDGQTV